MVSIESMSLESGAFLIAVLSTIIVSLLSCLKLRLSRFWSLMFQIEVAIVVPFALANGIYWYGAWEAKEATGSTAFGDYEMWAPVFIALWSIAGIVPSMVAGFLTRLLIRKVWQRSSYPTRD